MIDAIAIDDEPLALKVIESMCLKNANVNLLHSFTQPGEALKYLNYTSVDLIFCDIQMPSITGVKLVKSLHKNTMVIFTTAFSDYAVYSYELNAIDYLLKPINQKRFNVAISKAIEYLQFTNKKGSVVSDHLFIRADLSIVKVFLADILYVEGLADYLKIHIRDRKPIVARMTMKEMMEKLQGTDFIRVHRSFILPFSKIEAVKGVTIFVDGKDFPIGKTYVENFFNRYFPKSNIAPDNYSSQ